MGQYVVRRLQCHEVLENADNDAINASIKMHACFRVRVEWGIGSLKQKWRRFMKRCDLTRCTYIYIFIVACYLTTCLQNRYLDFIYMVLECNEDGDDDGWDGDL